MDIQQFAATFVDSTRSYIFIRPEDNLLILRPNQVHNLNDSAVEMLHALYSQPQVDVAAVLTMMSERYGVPQEQLADLQFVAGRMSLKELRQDVSGPTAEVVPRIGIGFIYGKNAGTDLDQRPATLRPAELMADNVMSHWG